MKLTSKNTKAELLWATESLNRRIRELEAELQVRDNMGNEVLRILREVTGKRDFHSEMEAAEHAAKMLAETLEKTDKLVLEAQRGERLAVDKLVDLRRELAEARRDAARYHHIRTASLIHWESGKIHNRISWPTIFAAEPVDGGNYRDRFDAAIDAAMEGKSDDKG